MFSNYLKPVSDAALAHLVLHSELSLGHTLKIHTKDKGVPTIQGEEIVILGVNEDRNALNNLGTGQNLDNIRKEFYQLFPGNWHKKIVDFGNIDQGNSIEDTYFAFKRSGHFFT